MPRLMTMLLLLGLAPCATARAGLATVLVDFGPRR